MTTSFDIAFTTAASATAAVKPARAAALPTNAKHAMAMVPTTIGEEIEEEMTLARRAQARWGPVPIEERLAWVKRLRHRLAIVGPDLAREITAASAPGRSEAEMLAAEVVPLADACRFLERRAAGLLRTRRLGAGGRPVWLGRVAVELRREALGVVLILAPANYPLLLPGVQAIQALTAGNAVLLKPGRGGSPAAHAFRALALAAGLDPGLLRVLAESPATGSAAAAARPDKVLLTGSAATGRLLLRNLAHNLVPAVVELSGSDALFVLPGADLDRVAAAIRFGLSWHGGATCIAPRRIFVPAALADALEEKLDRLVTPLPAVDLPSHLAALADEQIAEALAHGARLVAGGSHEPRTEERSADAPMVRFRPTVMAVGRGDIGLLRESSMAPVSAVVRVASTEDALALAGTCPYALGASIFGPRAAAMALAGKVAAGVVTIDDVIVPTADPRLPFGGRGASGYGVTRGGEGLLELTALKAVAVRRGGFLPHLESPASGDAEIFAGYLRAAHGGSWRQRLAGAAALLGALRRRPRGVPSAGGRPGRLEA